MAPPQINQSTIASISERIVQARRLYGADSAYIIGLFAGLQLAHEGDAGVTLCAKVQDQVLRMESGKGNKAPSGGGRAEPAAPRAEAPAAAEGDLAENTWVRGNVKWFNNDKGYGFISTAANTDVFVHWRDISSWDRSLAQGDEVEFMVTKTAKGFQAINVMKPNAEGDGTPTVADGAPASPPAAAAEVAAAEIPAAEITVDESAVAATPEAAAESDPHQDAEAPASGTTT